MAEVVEISSSGIALSEYVSLEYPDCQDSIWHCAWHPLGELLATCGCDGIIIWNTSLRKGTERHVHTKQSWKLQDNHTGTVRCVAWSPDGTYLASAGFDSTGIIWHYEDGDWEPYIILEGHKNELKNICWSTNRFVATCSRDKTVWIWELIDEDAEVVAVLQGHEYDVKTCAFFPESKTRILSGSFDSTIRLWVEEEQDEWSNVKVLSEHTGTVWDIDFDPNDPKRFCSVSGSLEVFIWNDLQLLHRIPTEHQLSIYTCSWSSLGIIATGARDNAICLYDLTLDEPKLIQTTSGHQADVNCVAWNPKYPEFLCSVSDDACVKIWKLDRALEEAAI